MSRCGYISRKPCNCEIHKGKRIRCTRHAGHIREKDWAAPIHFMGTHFWVLDSICRQVKVVQE